MPKGIQTLIIALLLCVSSIQAAISEDTPVEPANAASQLLKTLAGTISFQVWQYQGNKVAHKHVISVSARSGGVLTGRSPITDSLWKCVVKTHRATDGAISLQVTFAVAKGSLSSSGVALVLHFHKWSRRNYVLVPAAVYDGNRFRVVNSGYMAPYPKSYLYHKHSTLLISDSPRLSLERRKASRIEMLTGNAATPAMCFLSPALQRGFILLTQQKTRFGNSGMFIDENAAQNEATFVVSAPGVRQRVAGFGYFMKSHDRGADWTAGNSVTLRFRLYSFRATDIPDLLEKFMTVRKALTGPNHPRNLTPFSAITDFSSRYIEKHNWFTNRTGDFYRSDNDNKFQFGWTGGIVTFPLLALNSPRVRKRALENINFEISKMQGQSGYFYGFYDHGRLLSDRDNIPNAAMTRKNADDLFWLLKQYLLLKAQDYGQDVQPAWVQATERLAQAFVRTWNRNGQFGDYVNAKTGKIIIFNSTSGAIAPAGLALAGQYFKKPQFIHVAEAAAKYYYRQYVVKLGLTSGGAGDILQDPSSESAFGLLQSMMALYYVTGDRQWLAKAKIVGDLCATWTISYDEQFPPGSTLYRLGAHVAGAVFASVQNKHAAPGICTSGGSELFKLYRATGDRRYAELLRDIIHAYTEAMETPGHVTTGCGAGTSMERIQPTDAEGKAAIGQILHTQNTWCETSGMLMALEIPSIYVCYSTGEVFVFDSVDVKKVTDDKNGLTLQISNPTRFDAKISIFAESATQRKSPIGYTYFLKWPRVEVASGETKFIHVSDNGAVDIVPK